MQKIEKTMRELREHLQKQIENHINTWRKPCKQNEKTIRKLRGNREDPAKPCQQMEKTI